MHKFRRFLAVAVLLAALQACAVARPTEQAMPPATVIVEPTSSAPSHTRVPQTEAEVPRVSVEEARVALESGTAILVDVRSKAAYDDSHIAGAVSVPLGEIESNPNGLSLEKDQWIITYCT